MVAGLEGLADNLRTAEFYIDLSLRSVFEGEGVDNYASDYTGADAPRHARDEIESYLRAAKGIDYCFEHRFGSEDPTKKGEFGRKLLEWNRPPEYMFDDFLTRGARG